MVFKDRVVAGRLLARRLEKYKKSDAIVYTLPRGGAIVGFEVANYLDLPLDLIIVRKIGHPSSPEYALGAVSENEEVLSESEVAEMDPRWIKKQIKTGRAEIERRKRTYGVGEMKSAEGKIAILVDDGIATGFTTEVAVKEIKLQKPQKIVVAVPVVSPEIARRIEAEVDELVALDTPLDFVGSVGACYVNFPQVEDDEVIKLLR